MAKISVVINTWNEEKNIERCLKSVKWADEIVVVDMQSTDKTVEIAKKYGAKVFFHKYTGYVEPARNFALSKATGDWILILDADEEITQALAEKLRKVVEENKCDFVRLPRKNIIFGKWIKNSRWWPDYNIRFFKKGKVTWSDKIHSVPMRHGEGRKLEAKEANTIIHYHYQSISQYLERMNRYTDVQAKELIALRYKFAWQDILKKPAGEFLSRFFAGQGYKDGVHGLTLALLQAFSELVVYLKCWENNGFTETELRDIKKDFQKIISDFCFWQGKINPGILDKIRSKLKARI